MSLRILVTGASSGIGHDTAARLHGLGHEVHGLARRVERVGDGIIPVACDLSWSGSVHEALGDLGSPHRPIDALVHCAGYGQFAPLELTDVREAQRQMQVNVLSAVELAQQALPGMRAKHGGRIVLVSSIASRFSSPMGGWYHASKAALESVADTLRQEVAGFGVDVAVIQPGVVRTPWHETAMEHLVECTAGTPYWGEGRATADYHERSAASGLACDVEAVTDAIVSAVTSPRPRTRYLVGRGSRTATMLPRLVPDRTFDVMTRRRFGIPSGG